MTADIEEEPASPPCFAASAGSTYMGYAEQGSIARELQVYAAALRKVSLLASRRPDLCAGLEKQQETVAGLQGACGAAEGALPGGQVATEILARAIGRLQAFLPRIADDVLHRQLRELLGEGRAVLARLARPDGHTPS